MKCRSYSRSRHRDEGFTYLTALFVVAIFSGGLALVSEVWQTAVLRDREAELLFVGNQYRRAIERYYLKGSGQYPRNLSDLIKDSRQPTTERYLRQFYLDPITGNGEWGLVKAPDGGIMGVYSLSDAHPLRIAGFRLRDKAFEDTSKYSEWKFIYIPPQQSGPVLLFNPPVPR